MRSRSYSPDSSDFGNSPIKSIRGRSRSRTPSPSPPPPSSGSPARKQDRFFLALSNLTRNVNEGHLKEIFGCYGEIIGISYPMHPNTGYPTGRAVIEYSDSSSLYNSLTGMNGGQIDGNIIECSISKYATPPSIKFNREPKRRLIGNPRGRRPSHRGGDHYAPVLRNRTRSPIRRRSFSRSRSPVRRRREYSRSPNRHYPGRRRFSPLPPRKYSRSPVRRYSRSKSPIRSPIRSPNRRYSRSRSPVKGYSRSRSPVRRYSRSRSPVRRHSRSPRMIRQRSPSYSGSRSRSPRFNRRHTPSPRRLSPRNRSPSRSPLPVFRMNYQ